MLAERPGGPGERLDHRDAAKPPFPSSGRWEVRRGYDPAMPLPNGSTFAGYSPLSVCLGSGGMGEVYLAQHPRLPRQDALKVLRAGVSADDEYRQRFEREADIAATLWHPHIVGVHDRGEHDGQLWIAMDYVPGTDTARPAGVTPEGLPAQHVGEIVSAVAERWTMRISAVCCTATSKPPTSCSPISTTTVNSESCWPTSESPATSTTSAD